MGIIKIKDTARIINLCDGIEETMIYSCLQGCMGEVYVTDDYQSAQLHIADFCFFVGKPSRELLHNKVWGGFIILVPQGIAWESLITEIYPDTKKRTRYATKKNQHLFDKDILKSNVTKLPPQYRLEKINEVIYKQVMSENWSKDLCSQFIDSDDYISRGLGYVIIEENQVIAGASSYTIYNEGIEIEIDTRIDKRQQSLARIVASQLILDCLENNIYPSWDAHNKVSLDLALSLGYIFDNEYTVYELEE